jgi:hypothetical protein
MSLTWGWPTLAYQEKEKETKGMSTVKDSAPQNEEANPPKVIVERRGLTNGMKWFILVDATFLIFCLIAVLSGNLTRSDTTSVLQPLPTSSATHGGNAGQQPSATAPVGPVNSAAPTEMVYAYSNNDYVVGTGEGQIPPGRYQCNGDDKGFKFSSWTTYSDLDKQHILDIGSIGGSETRFMTVDQNAKMVSLNGDAVWIKAG